MVSPAAVASIVTVPARTPVIVLVATPAEAVALPVPDTVPAPDAFAKEMTVVLSAVTVLPAASSIVAVRTRVAPDVRFDGRAGEDDVGSGAVDDVERAERAGRQAGGGRLHRHGAGEDTGDRLRRDTARGGRVAAAADGADPGLLREGDHGGVVGGDRVPGRILDRGGQHARGAGGQVRRRAAERDLGRSAVDDVERAERARGKAGRSGLHRHGSGEDAGDRLGGDAGGGGRVARAADRARTGCLGEGDHGRVVGGDGVTGGVLDRRGQHPRRAGGEVGCRAASKRSGSRRRGRRRRRRAFPSSARPPSPPSSPSRRGRR